MFSINSAPSKAIAAFSSLALVLALTPAAAFAAGDSFVSISESDELAETMMASPVHMVSTAATQALEEATADEVEASPETAPDAQDATGAEESDESQDAGMATQALAEDPDEESEEPLGASDEQDGVTLETQAASEEGETSDEGVPVQTEADASSSSPSSSTSPSPTATDDSSSASSSSASASSHTPPVAGPHTVSWANTAADAKSWFDDAAAVHANGTAELVSVKLPSSDGGTELSVAELSGKTSSDPAYYLKGVLCAPEGSTVTMKILPNRGYQLLKSSICGGKITLKAIEDDDDEQVGMYTFSMPAEGVALDCGFTAVSDIVETDSDAVVSGTITADASVVANGTLELDITDLEDEDDKSALAAKASSKSAVVAYLDITLDNVINQGNADDAWYEPLESLSSAVELHLKLSDSVAGSETQFYVIRDHEGNFQQASATYDSATKTITFKSDKFSNYAIVKGAPGSSNTNGSTSNNSSGSTTPKTGDTNPIVPVAVIAVVAAFIAAFSFSRMRRE